MKEITNEIKNNPVLNEVQNVLIQQTEKGLAKYGTTVQYQELNVAEWISHAKEETADKLVYLTCLENSLKELESKGEAFDEIHGILCDFEFAGTLSEEMAIDYIKKAIKKAFIRVAGEENCQNETKHEF